MKGLFDSQEESDRWFDLAREFVDAVKTIAAAQKPARTKAPQRKSGEWQATKDLIRKQWNLVAQESGIPLCETLTESMGRNLRARIDDTKKTTKCDDAAAIASVVETMKKIPGQPFACGKRKGSNGRTWKCTLQRFLTADIYVQVQSNAYADDKQNGATDAGRVRSGSFLAGRGKTGAAKVGAKGD